MDPRPSSRAFRIALAASLGLCALLYVPFTVRWPLVGDASLIHYIAFLIERGWAPYVRLGDMNMPGSFLVEIAAMHIFGPNALGWRLFDFALMIAAGWGFFVVCARRNWLAALFGGSLFVLAHGRDGLGQGGQRDLTMAVCLLTATACLLLCVRRGSLVAAAGFGLLSGLAVTIKPTALLLTMAQALLVSRAVPAVKNQLRRRGVAETIAVVAGWVVAPAICLGFLIRERAVEAFFTNLHGVVPYYAGLGHRPLGYVLTHSLSPFEPLVAVWFLLLLARGSQLRGYFDLPRRLLVAGVLFGWLNCILQHRALPYYRYPLLAFLLPLMALDLTAAAFGTRTFRAPAGTPVLPARVAFARVIALAGLAFGGFFLAPQSAALLHRYRWYQTDMLDSLERNLQGLGGSALSGRVQCIDSVSGCGTVLYRMRLEPATGVLSDFLLFGNSTDSRPPDEIPIIRRTRAELLAAISSHPPELVVVTSHLHMTGPENFGKLNRWPMLQEILATRYRLATEWHPGRPERWWSREEYPAAYRIYVLRAGQPGTTPVPASGSR